MDGNGLSKMFKSKNLINLTATKIIVMKKAIIASVVGGIILFIWQFLSWALIDFHQPAQQYTEKQGVILDVLASQQLPEGGYIMPSLPKTASEEEWKRMMTETEGKPWASVQYHHSRDNNMVMNMVRGFLINIITIFIFCWILFRLAAPTFQNIFLASLFTGLIIFLNVPYINFIWYQSHDIYAHLADAIVSWGLVGLWLGWFLSRGNRVQHESKVTRREPVIAD